MSTNTFDREIVITSPEAVERLREVMESDPPEDPMPWFRFDEEDLKRGEELFELWCARFRKQKSV
ncbi:MAG: hypothetical protein E7280_07125 [Lachnospiraceae bacterium]|jgi:hypothetical protein|nr:hypothetical protein [Lachnospiraceae bacterium]